MTTTHTPGPWKIIETPFGERSSLAVEGDGFRPAEILRDGAKNKGTAIANARLIAAAPDLLAACELAEGLVESLNCLGVEYELQTIRKAIAKARAKSPRS